MELQIIPDNFKQLSFEEQKAHLSKFTKKQLLSITDEDYIKDVNGSNYTKYDIIVQIIVENE